MIRGRYPTAKYYPRVLAEFIRQWDISGTRSFQQSEPQHLGELNISKSKVSLCESSWIIVLSLYFIIIVISLCLSHQFRLCISGLCRMLHVNIPRHSKFAKLMTMVAHGCQTHESCTTRSGPKDYGDTHHALLLT